jgi:hypothetical protein
MIEILLNQGANIERKGFGQCSPLTLGKSSNNEFNFCFINFCFEASRKGYLKAIKILIKKGADTETQDYNGYTPLYWGNFKNFTTILIN